MENLQIELVNVVDKKVVTTSLKVAEMFEKEHKHVMRSIRDLIDDGIDKSNFGLISQKDSMNREQYVYILDRKGFTLLAMGFTGKEALKFKVAYIVLIVCLKFSICNCFLFIKSERNLSFAVELQ